MATSNLQLPTPKAPVVARRWWAAAVLGSWALGAASHPALRASSVLAGTQERVAHEFVVLENEHVRVVRNYSPCAHPSESCQDRIFVALLDAEITTSTRFEDKERGIIGGTVNPAQRLKRGDIVVVGPSLHYSTTWWRGDFLEVTIKPRRPPVKSPPIIIPPDKNSILHDGNDFFVFEEKLDPGDTRARHSHRERVVIVLNKTRLQQWPDGAPELLRDQVPDDVRFNPPVVHVVKTVGDLPLRNIVIELKR